MARADFPNDEAWLRSLGIDRETNPNNPSSWKPDLQARWTDHINTLAPERQAKLTVERPGVVVRPIGEDLKTIPANGPTSPEPGSAPIAQPTDVGKFSINPETYQPTEAETAAGTDFFNKFGIAYGRWSSKVDARKAKAELQANFPVIRHFDQLSEAHSAIREQLNRVPGQYSTTGDLPETVGNLVDEAYKPKVQALLDRAKEIRGAQKILSATLAPFKTANIEPPRDELPASLRFDHLLAPVGDTGPKGIDESDWSSLNPEARKLTMDYIDAHNDFEKNHLDDQGRIRVDQNRMGVNVNDPLHNTGALDKYHALHDIRQKIEKSLSISGKKADKDAAEMQTAQTLRNYPYGLIRSVDVAPRTNPVADSVAPSDDTVTSLNANATHEQKAEGHIANYMHTYKSVMDRVGRSVSGLSSGDMTTDERSSLIDSLHQATTHYTRHLGDEKKATDLVRLKLRDMPLNPEYANEKDPKARWGTGRMLDQ